MISRGKIPAVCLVLERETIVSCLSFFSSDKIKYFRQHASLERTKADETNKQIQEEMGQLNYTKNIFFSFP